MLCYLCFLCVLCHLYLLCDLCHLCDLCVKIMLHIFNPEHDIALAANSKHWTAPHAGRKLRADLGWLPALWASDGDIILVDDVEAAKNAVRKLKHPTANAAFVSLDNINKLDINNISPWGWDKAICQQLRCHGISDAILPSDDILNRQRQLSDRAVAARLLAAINNEMGDVCGEAVVAESFEQMTKQVMEWGSAVLKSPWSSSGRGVRFINGIDELSSSSSNIVRWVDNVLRNQGHIMVERKLDKIKDFGMEFTALADGTVRYDGLSLFSTVNGAYTGNILATEEEKQSMLTRYLSLQLLADVQQFICSWMQQEIRGAYVGPFGVDMMACAEKEKPTLNPCVEINLRRTMGHVALAISPCEPGKQLIMNIGYEGTGYHFRLHNDHELYY